VKRGIDVSKWDAAKLVAGKNVWTPIDWRRARDESKIALAIIKASEGMYEDPAFPLQWAAAKPHLPRMAYHYFRADVNAIQAAAKFVDILRRAGYDPRYDSVALDVEVKPTLMLNATFWAYVGSWLYEVEKALGDLPYIYVGYWFAVETKAPPTLGRYPLWLAQYPYDFKDAPLYDAITLSQWEARVASGLLWPRLPTDIWKTVAIWQMTARCMPSNIAGYPTGPGTKLAVDWNILYFDPPTIGAPVVRRCLTCGQLLP
jgi:GH25 family lysozyme M1 (1,4-beta-N-acetylmuramidase)